MNSKVEKQEPVAYRVETGYEQPFYMYTHTLPTRGKWDALYTAPQPCPPASVFVAGNRVSTVIFASRNDADAYVTSVPTSAGVVISEVPLVGTVASCPECEKLKADGMVLVTKEDAENYCRILTLLGMEEEGSPIETVERLLSLREGMVCADCQDTGWLENREEGKYPCTCMTEAEPYQLLEAERDELTRQVAHWKANHASVVEQARILKERPDMPIERVKAYESWVVMAAQVEKMWKALDVAKDLATVVINHPDFDNDNPIEPRPFVALIQRFEAQFDEALAPPDLSTGILNRVRADALDAKRYRWLRSSSVGPAQIWELLSDDCNPPVMTLKSMGDLDAAIDSAMAADMEAGKC